MTKAKKLTDTEKIEEIREVCVEKVLNYHEPDMFERTPFQKACRLGERKMAGDILAIHDRDKRVKDDSK